MLQIIIPANETYDEVNNLFINSKAQTLQLEHSLVSLSKWESKWKRPFLTKEKKTIAESVDYIKCMTLTQNVHPDVYVNLTNANITEVSKYIDEPMTATWFGNDTNQPPSREVVTAEIIYNWMITLNIPFECQKWHLNRLLTLIRVTNIKNSPKKKMNKKELMTRNTALNKARMEKLKNKG